MILIDSSGWIEFFADGPRAGRYAPYLKRPDEVVTPTVVLFEAGDLSLRHSLSMADAFILATARHAKCSLASDAHFQGLAGVTYIA